MWLGIGSVWGQSGGYYHETLDINQVAARVYNSGEMFTDLGASIRYEVPQGSGIHSAFVSSLWVGGRDLSGNLKMAGHLYRSQGNDYYPGPFRTSGQYDTLHEFTPPFAPLSVMSLQNGRLLFLDSEEFLEYDPVSRTSRTFTYPIARGFPGVVELANGNLLLHGDVNPPNRLPIYEIDAGSFSVVHTDTLLFWQRQSAVNRLPDGRVLFAGVLGSEIYDPVNHVSTSIANMPTGVIRSASLVLSDGRVLLSGGSTTLGGVTGVDAIQLYDPVTDTWTSGPPMSTGRVDHNILEMLNGEILMIGGSFLNSLVDRYQPLTNVLAVPDTIDFVLRQSVLLNRPDSTVLVAGINVEDYSDFLFAYTPGQNEIENANLAVTGDQGAVLGNGNLMVSFFDNTFREIDPSIMHFPDQRWQKVWKVSQSEIDQFQFDFQNGTVDFGNYPDIESWPAHGNTALGEDAQLAPYVDLDQDGVYDPLNDGDYPCIQGDQSLWWVFNDDAGPHLETGGDKLGIQVEAMAYAYDCNGGCPTPLLDHQTFYHYEIQNKSFTALEDVYLTLWVDAEMGNIFDDNMGTDPGRGLAFIYNDDDFDETGDDYLGYGPAPPAMGYMHLNGPLSGKFTHIMSYDEFIGFESQVAMTPEEFYRYQQAQWRDGTPLTVGGDGFGGSVPTKFSYPGDPGFCGPPDNGWNVVADSVSIYDHHFMCSVGPFDLDAFETVNFDFAVVWARGMDHYDSVCELREVVDSLEVWYAAEDKSCLQPIVGREEVRNSLPVGALEVFPHPADREVTVAWPEALKKPHHLRVVDALGRVVFSQTVGSGLRELDLSTGQLPAGMYQMRLEGASGAYHAPLQILH